MMPAYSYSRASFLFFGTFVVVATFFLLNVVIAVVCNAYNELVEKVGDERDAFRAFLRASLASLDADIVDTVCRQFDEHSQREDDAIMAAAHFLRDACKERLLPEFRYFQDLVDAAQPRCTPGVAHAADAQRRTLVSAARRTDRSAARAKASSS